MRRHSLIIMLMVGLISICAKAQTGAANGFCVLGGTKAVTLGTQSTNYLNGIVPVCTVTVYLTNTTTLATIYSNSSNTTLGNPFKASFSGQWLFYAAISQGYDVVLNGGIYPNFYNTPVTMKDIFTGGSSGGSAGVTSINSTTGAFSFTGPGVSCIGTTCTFSGGGGGSVTLQTNGTNNSSQTSLNFITSTTNAVGLSVTPSNPGGGGNEKMEVTGTATPAGGGTGGSGTGYAYGNGSSNFTYSTTIPLSNLATQVANSVVGNGTGSTAAPTALSMPNCSAAIDALTWVTNSGIGCNTSITAANLSGATQYSIPYQSAAGNTGYVSPNVTGTTDQVLTSSSVAGSPSAPTLKNAPALSAANMTSFPSTLATYPGAGVANSTGTAWGTSYTVGTAANNLVQLNASAQLPAVSGVNLTGITLAQIAAGSSPSGTYDFSGATQIKLPVAASFATLANGEIGYDTTNKNWHIWDNAADSFIAVFSVASPPTSGDCVEFLKTTNSWSLQDAGSACGSGGGSGALSAITAATAANTIASGNHFGQVWNWAITTPSSVAFTFGETSAATGSGDEILAVTTITGSTAVPLTVTDSLNSTQTLPALQILPTWNTSGVVDAALLINVTNTSSGTGSLLADFQVGGTSQWKVDKAGNETVGGSGTFGVSGGQGGTILLPEGTAATSTAANDILYADSTLHGLKGSYNNGSFLPLPLSTGTITSGGLNYDSGSSGSLIASSADFTISSHTLTGGASAIINLSAASTTAGLLIPSAAGAVPTADGQLAVNTTTHAFVTGSNGTTIVEAAAATGTGTSTTCTSQVITAISAIAAPTCTTLTAGFLPTVPIANGGTNATSAPSAGAVPNTSSTTASSWTVTPTLGLSGTAGTLSLFPTSGNFTTTLGSAATASNTVNFFATAPTTGDLIDCVTSSTTCTLTDSGVLAANVVTSGSAYAQYDVPYYSGASTSRVLTGVAIAGFQFDSTSGAPAAATATNLGTLANITATQLVFSAGTSSALAGSANLTWSSPTLTIGASGTAGNLTEFNNTASTTWASAATTSNTIKGFAVVPSNNDLFYCAVSSTTCTLTDTGFAYTAYPAADIAVGALANGMTATTQSAGDTSADLATDSFVSTAVANAIAGVNPAVAVLAASTANVTGTYTQVGGGIGDTFTVTATGAFTLDGIAINTIGQRILLKNQTSANQNGIYTATVVGTTGVSPVFTRALDYDTPSDVNNTGSIPVQSGTVNTTTSWLLTSQVTSIGSSGSSLTYAQFSIAPTTLVTSASALTANNFVTGAGSQGVQTVAITGIVQGNGGSAPAAATGHQLQVPLACADSSGSGTAQSCSTGGTTYAPAAYDCVLYSTTTTNSGTGLTTNVNSLGAKSVAIAGASGWTTTLTASIIPANKPQLLCYDGTNWDDMQTGTAASGGSSAFPLTVSGTVNSGGIPYFNSTTQESSSAAGTSNVLMKWGGAGNPPTNSSVTDNGTVVSTTEPVTSSYAGTASQSSIYATGAPYTGGSGTTNFPLLYLNDGTGPTTFSTAGTEIGINSPSGFTGNFEDYHVNGGAALFQVTYQGNEVITQTAGTTTALNITNSTAATSTVAQSSPFDIRTGQFWYNPEFDTSSPPVAAASAADCWSHQVIETGGSNGASTYSMAHNGTAGCIGTPATAVVQVPYSVSYGAQTNAIAQATAPTVVEQGTSGATDWSYGIVACTGQACSNVSTVTQITNGASTLSTSQWNKVTWAAVTGADYYKVYRTQAAGNPSSTGAVCLIPAGATLECDDKGLTADATTAQVYNASGQMVVGSGPAVGGGTGGGMFGAGGTVPSTLVSTASGWYANTANSCFDIVNGTTDEGCGIAVAGAQTMTGAKTFSGGVVNTTTPIRDQTRFVLAANMTAVATAGVNIGSTGAGNSTFSWPVTSANWYDLECKLPVTFVASATIKFQLVSISGSVTVSNVNAETMGNTGASAVFQDLATIAGTTLATSATPVTGAPGGVSEQITYSSQFLTSHAGNIGLEFIGNGTNNVQMLLGGECGITQIN